MRVNNAVKRKFWQNFWKVKWIEKKNTETRISNSEYWSAKQEKVVWKKYKKEKVFKQDYNIWDTIIISTYKVKEDCFYKNEKDYSVEWEKEVCLFKRSWEEHKSIFNHHFINVKIELKIQEVKLNKRWRYFEYTWIVTNCFKIEKEDKKHFISSFHRKDELTFNSFKEYIIWKEIIYKKKK